MRIPGKEFCLTHIITPSDACIYENLGLHIGVHEGEDHRGEAIDLFCFTPWVSVVVSTDIEIRFMDRFCGSLIITSGLAQVEEVVRYFGEGLGFQNCDIHKS